jgi:hypothetical protein
MMSVIDGGNGEERKKGRTVGMERQRRSRKGKGMVSVLVMAGKGKRGQRMKG